MCHLPLAPLSFISLLAAEFFASWGMTIILQRWLLAHNRVAIPNHRSSHTQPTPLGGGLGVVAIVLLLWIARFLLCPTADIIYPVMLTGAIILAVISWLDDCRDLSFTARLVIQLLVVAAVIFALPNQSLLFPNHLPVWAERVVLIIGAVWFINLYNFMDGINGMLGINSITIAAGLALVAPHKELAQLALFIIPAVLGFLMLNWGRAKIFSGDIGSITLGFLLGWLMLQTAIGGRLVPAFIIALYPILDATITLLRRICRGEKFWQPHRAHFYQKAVQGGLSHAQTAGIVFGVNLLMIALAWAALRYPLPAFIAALAVVSAVLIYFERRYECQALPSSPAA